MVALVISWVMLWFRLWLRVSISLGNSGKNLAVGLAVKIPHRHSADLLRNIFPQAVGQLLRHIRHDKALNKAERSADHIQADQKQQDFPDFSEIDTGASLEFIHQPLTAQWWRSQILGPTIEKMVLPMAKTATRIIANL